MKMIQWLSTAVLVLFSATAWSYGGGGGGGTKACTKPKFDSFKPPHMSEVSPQAQFSFQASSKTSPSSIAVTVKKLPVEVTVEESSSGYLVSGELPAELNDTFARVTIEGKTKSQCFGSDGWLLKVK